MPTLSIHIPAIVHTDDRKIRNLTVRLCQALSELCQDPLLAKSIISYLMFAHTDKTMNKKNIGTLETSLYLYEEDYDIKSIALVVQGRLTNIATLPQHRNKGYAVKLLKGIQQVFRCSCKEWLVSSPVAQHVRPLFEKAGWIYCDNDNELNKDDTINMCPPEMLDRYNRLNEVSMKLDGGNYRAVEASPQMAKDLAQLAFHGIVMSFPHLENLTFAY